MNRREQKTVDAFHNLYYQGPESDGHIYTRTKWMGVPCEKCPLDMWIYQEILFDVRPDLIIETGTRFGGSALYLAHMLDILGNGEIVTIDIDDTLTRPQHPRITYVSGSSGEAGVIGRALAGRQGKARLVILDSDHSYAHVKAELSLLAQEVTVGSYLIVEDTNVNGHPTFKKFGPGPFEAVEEFLKTHTEFVVDVEREKFLMTFNPRGFLRRTS